MRSAPQSPPSGGRTSALRGVARRFDIDTWAGATLCMTVATAMLWVILIADALDGYRLNRFGLRPRTVHGLDGIVTMPFLHASAAHMLANMFPFLIIGMMALVHNLRGFLLSTAIIVVGGGAVTWVIGPDGTVVGASGLVFGWLGYLLARAYFARKIIWILGAAFALFMFGGLFSGLVPTVHSEVAWQAHVAGLAAGAFAGWLLHPRKGSAPRRLPMPALRRR